MGSIDRTQIQVFWCRPAKKYLKLRTKCSPHDLLLRGQIKKCKKKMDNERRLECCYPPTYLWSTVTCFHLTHFCYCQPKLIFQKQSSVLRVVSHSVCILLSLEFKLHLELTQGIVIRWHMLMLFWITLVFDVGFLLFKCTVWDCSCMFENKRLECYWWIVVSCIYLLD